MAGLREGFWIVFCGGFWDHLKGQGDSVRR